MLIPGTNPATHLTHTSIPNDDVTRRPQDIRSHRSQRPEPNVISRSHHWLTSYIRTVQYSMYVLYLVRKLSNRYGSTVPGIDVPLNTSKTMPNDLESN
jgi:hypothetical protein